MVFNRDLPGEAKTSTAGTDPWDMASGRRRVAACLYSQGGGWVAVKGVGWEGWEEMAAAATHVGYFGGVKP